MLAEGTPRLSLVALIRSGLAPGRCLHLLGQLLGAAGRDKRPLAADRDPHAFHGVKQNAPSGEPGPELARVVSRMDMVDRLLAVYTEHAGNAAFRPAPQL